MSNSLQKSPLPEDWTPSDHDVVVGKGKKFFFHPGNVMLRDFVASILPAYSKATTKTGKSGIISTVVEHINEKGHFVKRDPMTAKWIYADDRLCREKCSQTFRDSLHEIYRSSSVAKKNRRREQQQQEEEQPASQISADDVAPRETKRMRLEQAVFQPLSISSNSFQFDWDTLMAPKTTKDAVSLMPEKDNLLPILSELVTIPLVDEDDGNPFEPTPLSSVHFDLDSSSMLEPRPLFEDPLTGGNAMYPATYCSVRCSEENSFLDDFSSFVTDGIEAGLMRFQDEDDVVVSPNFEAAFAA